MFYLGFFVGWFIGVFSALLLLYIIRSEMEQVADGERVCRIKQKKEKTDD